MTCDPNEVGIELDSSLSGVAEQLLETFVLQNLLRSQTANAVVVLQ